MQGCFLKLVLTGTLLLGVAGCANSPANSTGTSNSNSSAQRAYTAWGDSLTQGQNGFVASGDYPDDLQALLGPSSPVHNQGVGGQTSIEIGVREGGIPTTVSVVGGVIPASSSVAVTFPAGYAPVTASSVQVAGTISGVHGIINMITGGTLMFTRSIAGDAVPKSNNDCDAVLWRAGRINPDMESSPGARSPQ